MTKQSKKSKKSKIRFARWTTAVLAGGLLTGCDSLGMTNVIWTCTSEAAETPPIRYEVSRLGSRASVSIPGFPDFHSGASWVRRLDVQTDGTFNLIWTQDTFTDDPRDPTGQATVAVRRVSTESLTITEGDAQLELGSCLETRPPDLDVTLAEGCDASSANVARRYACRRGDRE